MDKRTNFEVCRQINELAGNTLQHSLETARKQFVLIASEFNEMTDHVSEGDLEKLRDDVADVLFTAYGMAARLGFPADKDFKEVCRSNFTKFDKTVDDAKLTAAKYLENGVETYYTPAWLTSDTQVFVTYSAVNQTGNDGKYYPKGKWLKSVYFEEPVYEPLVLEEV